MEVLIVVCIFIIALMYSSVGHGGASGYLAVMAIFSVSPAEMRYTALLLNLFVSGISFIQYYRAGFFLPKIFLPFVIGSIPMSFIGATITLEPFWYNHILAVCLLFAVLRILWKQKSENETRKNFPWVAGVFIGAGIGLLSGMIGIGGGILLSPVLLLMRWASIKETAAVSAPFIFVNSAAGLFGLTDNFISPPHIYSWILVAILGGFCGAYFGSTKLSSAAVRKILATVLTIAVIKLFLK